MAMLEALASGTPGDRVPEGAASEIVIKGENGFLVANETEMAAAAKCLGSIDAVRCGASVAERYDVSVTVAGYQHVCRQAITAHGRTSR